MSEYLHFPGKELNVTITQSNKFFKKNNKTGHINLFPSCYAFLKFSKTRKKINRTFSDLLDKKTRIDTEKGGWGKKRGEELSPHLAHFRF